jgi:hypothetical protein
MASVDFNQVVEQVRALTPSQQWQLYIMLDTWLTFPPDLTEEEFRQEMVRRGELTVPPPLTAEDIRRFHEWKPVEIEGEPLSETIIKERGRE